MNDDFIWIAQYTTAEPGVLCHAHKYKHAPGSEVVYVESESVIQQYKCLEMICSQTFISSYFYRLLVLCEPFEKGDTGMINDQWSTGTYCLLVEVG